MEVILWSFFYFWATSASLSGRSRPQSEAEVATVQ